MTTEKIMQMSKEEVVDIALTAGKILLISGAETYRVEDTITRLCAWRKIEAVNVFCTPTVIIIGNERSDGFNCIARITSRSTNLMLISQINDISYNFGNWPYDYQETKKILGEMLAQVTLPSCVFGIASGFGSAGFAVMLGGNAYDFGAAFITGFVAMFVIKKLSGFRPSAFWENALAGIMIGLVALTCCHFMTSCTLEKVIVGAIMPFLPGVAFTNGLRDYMAGDLLSGNARVAEAMLFAASLAMGIGVALRVWWMI